VNRTGIEWTDFSANPLKYRDGQGRVVWGCVHVSDGCRNCYAESLAKRYGRGGPFTAPTMARLEPFLDETELRHMLKAKRIGGRDVAGSRCFVGDMTDLFGEWVTDAQLDRLFATFALRPDVTFQVLTKRADRMRAYLSEPGRRSEIMAVAERLAFDAGTTGRCALPPGCAWAGGDGDSAQPDSGPGDVRVPVFAWPLLNVWLGTSVEDQRAADERIPHLLQTPAAVRFLSVEPLLGPVDLDAPGYDWVIVGGESGPGARPCDVAWIRSIVEQCKAAGVPAFVKQMGARLIEADGCGMHRLPDGRYRIPLRDPKGGDPAEWPEDLRVRQFPASCS
jgi:protein gp37